MADAAQGNRQIDIQIARDVLGKKPCLFRETAMFSAWLTAWQCACENTSGCYPENQHAQDHGHSPLAKYSKNLDAAWDALEGPTSRFQRVRGYSSCGGEDYRLCRDYPEQSNYWLEYMTPGGLKKGPSAKTPALAICLAALEAVRG